MRRFALFLATCGYVGFAPFAPGTFGSAVGLAIFYIERALGVPPAVELSLIGLLLAAGVWSAGIAEHELGTDPGPVVLDEVVGMLMTLALLPVNIWGALTGFLLFRVLDVVKPWPARRFERLHGGLGVMADDVMAGVYGNLAMLGLIWILPGWFV